MPSEKLYKLTVHVPETLRDRLVVLAERDHRSVKAQILWCLERYVSEEKGQHHNPATRKDPHA